MHIECEFVKLNSQLLHRNASKEALLVHVRKHSKPSTIQPPQEKSPEKQEPSEVAASDVSISYRCGHCNQVSNWKHVIQVSTIILLTQ